MRWPHLQFLLALKLYYEYIHSSLIRTYAIDNSVTPFNYVIKFLLVFLLLKGLPGISLQGEKGEPGETGQSFGRGQPRPGIL